MINKTVKAVLVSNNIDFVRMCENIGFDLMFIHRDIYDTSLSVVITWPHIYGELLSKADCVIFDIGEGDARRTRVQTIVRMCEDIGMPVYWSGDIYNMFVDKNLEKEVVYKDGTFDRASYWDAIIGNPGMQAPNVSE